MGGTDWFQLTKMKHDEFESPEIKRIDREAAEWVAQKIGGLSGKDQDSFFDWLAADPRHGERYARHQKLWKNMDQLAEWMPEHSDKPNQDLLKYHFPRQLWGWLGAMAAVLVLGFLAIMIADWSDRSDAALTNLVANAYERHKLSDDSVLELNQGAALRVQYSKALRRVELVSGEVHFNVAKNLDRPFVVRVRDIDIRAVGTAFNVRLTNEMVQVIVTEGRVWIDSLAREESIAGKAEYDTPVLHQELDVGQMTEVPLIQGGAISPKLLNSETRVVSLGEMNKMLSWKPQMFEFNSTPLAEVIETFNSRNRTHLIIRDPELGKRPIVASFRSTNVDHFVELLQLSMNLEVEREGENIILYSAR